jgi:hypothetical protein
LLTLNQIHAQIVALANAHYQIAEVGMGTIAELQGKPDRLYPLLWLSNEGGSLEDNYKVDNIRLTMFGRVIVGEEGQDDDASEIEVLSDMQLILLDFLNYFHQQHGQEYVTDKAATLEHFTERTNDRTAGYSCVLELKQFYDWNKCNIPQSGAVIPPTIDGLTLYDFCDQSVIDRLTATQVACLEAELCGTCADATVQLNGTTVGTIPSGDSDSFTVNLDGSPSGSWDGTAWQVTSTPCADATVELNGVEMATIPSGDTENISVRQSSGATEVGSKQGVHWRIDDSAISINGSPVADVKAEDSLDIDVTQDGSPVGSWNGSAWIVPAAIAPSLSIEVYSDAGYTIPVASLNYGATAYIKVTPTGITPTSYTFFFGNGTKNAPQVTQVGDSLAWVITLTGTVTISATATDGTDATADATPFTLTVPNTYIGGKAVKTDGVVDRIHGWVNKNRLWDTYGFGFCFIDPTSASGTLVGMAGFGMVNLSSGSWNSKAAIDISGRPNQTWIYTSVPNALNHLQRNMTKDVSQFFYVQVTASNVEIYINGVKDYSTARASTAPLRSTEISLGYTQGYITPRNATFWNPLITNGLLSEAEVLSLSNACLAGTDPTAVATSKILECWDFGRLTLGVPSTDVYNPTTAVGMIEDSPLYLTNTFTAPDGIVSL